MLVMSDELKVLCGIFFVIIEMKKEWCNDDVLVIVKVVVLGGGLMGVGIVYVSVVKVGVLVCIKDVVEKGISNVMNYSYKILDKK